MPRISLIHATPVAMPPVRQAFTDHWPEATVTNLLEDSLSPDFERDGTLTGAMITRFEELGRYVFSTGADALLFTCSAFGEAIDRVKATEHPKPVLKPNEAMFEEALSHGDRIAMLATFKPSIASMEAEFREMAESRGQPAEIHSIWVEGAMAALLAGDAERHNELVATAVTELDDCDTVMLAHFSTAQAKPAMVKRTDVPVLTSPESAVNKLKTQL